MNEHTHTQFPWDDPLLTKDLFFMRVVLSTVAIGIGLGLAGLCWLVY